MGFGVLILLNYNAGWATVQRFYSVKDERAARKVGLLAAGLNVVGPPLFYLPVMLARGLIPELETTRHAYVAVALELLPVGMMGIMITAMLAATMSSLSSEYNVLASVATKDIYNRVFDRAADDRRLLAAGRVFTAIIGAIVMGIAILVALYPDIPLFSLMVTIFGVAVAPMMLPLLGGLIFRSLSLRGAMFGFIVGLVVGFTNLYLQQRYLPSLPNLDAEWITFQFGAYAIFLNVGLTALAMFLWTVFERRSAAEKARIDEFFVRMDTPIEADRERSVATTKGPSPFLITGIAVAGIGTLLLLVSFFEATAVGRWANVAAGVTLVVVGALIYRGQKAAATNDQIQLAGRSTGAGRP
jgi:SSS family solute:Na+ symporter